MELEETIKVLEELQICDEMDDMPPRFDSALQYTISILKAVMDVEGMAKISYESTGGWAYENIGKESQEKAIASATALQAHLLKDTNG